MRSWWPCRDGEEYYPHIYDRRTCITSSGIAVGDWGIVSVFWPLTDHRRLYFSVTSTSDMIVQINYHLDRNPTLRWFLRWLKPIDDPFIYCPLFKSGDSAW